MFYVKTFAKKRFWTWLNVKHFCWTGRIKCFSHGQSTAAKTFCKRFTFTCNQV